MTYAQVHLLLLIASAAEAAYQGLRWRARRGTGLRNLPEAFQTVLFAFFALTQLIWLSDTDPADGWLIVIAVAFVLVELFGFGAVAYRALRRRRGQSQAVEASGR